MSHIKKLDHGRRLHPGSVLRRCRASNPGCFVSHIPLQVINCQTLRMHLGLHASLLLHLLSMVALEAVAVSRTGPA